MSSKTVVVVPIILPLVMASIFLAAILLVFRSQNRAGAKPPASKRRKREPSPRSNATSTRSRSTPGDGPAKNSARSSSSTKSSSDARHEMEHALKKSDGDVDDTEGGGASEDEFEVDGEDEDGGYRDDYGGSGTMHARRQVRLENKDSGKYWARRFGSEFVRQRASFLSAA